VKLNTTEEKVHWCKIIMAEVATPVGTEVEPEVLNGALRGFGSYAMMILPCGCKGLYHREELQRMDQT
jgi:hypothetical protein